MKLDSDFEFPLKVIVIGDTCVGKTNFIFRFVENRFSLNYVSTVGFDYRSKIITLPKSKKKVAVQMLQDLAQCFAKNDFNYTKRLWNTAAGTVSPFLKRWIIDCDITDEFTMEDRQNVIDIVYESSPVGYKMIGVVPTLHGYHVITTPFDIRRLKDEYPSIDIHRNNPTVLYVPDSLMK